LGWLPPTVACAANWTRGSALPAVKRGALCLLDCGKFYQVPHLAVKVPLGWVLRLWQRLQEDRRRCDVLARTELLRELHACVVDDVADDRTCASTRRTRGVHPLRPVGGRWRLFHGQRCLLAMEGIFAVGLRVDECVLALVHWGVCLLGRHHPLWRVTIGHGTHARQHGCSL